MVQLVKCCRLEDLRWEKVWVWCLLVILVLGQAKPWASLVSQPSLFVRFQTG